MNRKLWMSTVAVVLAVAGAWLFWPHARSQAIVSREGVPPNAGAAKARGGGGKGPEAAAATPKFPTLNTNKVAFRLSNTTNTIRELANKPHAILLGNAFIDTDEPLNLKIPPHLRSTGDPGAYIVEAKGRIDARFRAELAEAGAQIVSYIPNNAYLVNLSAAGATALAGKPEVQAVLPYEPYYKLQPSLIGLAVNQQQLPPGTALTLGIFGSDAAAADQALEKLGAKIIGHDRSAFGPVVKVLAPPDWTSLAQSAMVQFIEPMHAHRLANDLSRVNLGISPDPVSPITNDWMGLTGNKVMVAVNDTGIDAKHPDFSLTGTAEAPGTTPPTRVFGLGPLDLVDTNGHGTHVAGIIAGNGSESYTVEVPPDMEPEGSVSNADFRGKAPLADLFSLRYEDSDFELQTNAALVGALISNNSWDYGNGAEEYDLAAASYDAATRDALPFSTGSQPVLFVFAAGNTGDGKDDGTQGSADTVVSPGTAKDVITVGALEQFRNITNLVSFITAGVGTNPPTTNMEAYWQPKTDSSEQVADYSARGNVGVGVEGNYGRFKPDVVAPGNFVVSTRSSQWDTNAYYNPTNISVSDYPAQVVRSNNPVYYNVAVPPNAVAVDITIIPNYQSAVPFPTNIIIYAKQSSYPLTNDYDIVTASNSLDIPPCSGGAITGIQAIQGNGFSFAVADPTNFPVDYDLIVQIYATNTQGNLYQVLEGMNEQMAPYYRYESGTSMAAAGVSGLLALIQDYFTNTLSTLPSPALMKALLINGARSQADYVYSVTNVLNAQGWGSGNIQNSLPPGGTTGQYGTPSSSFFVEQNPTNALATGDSHTYIVNIDPTTYANYLPLQATLVWTDPAGDPSAALKLVNNLDLIITNLDTGDVNFGSVYVGNDISPDTGFNEPWDTNGPPNLDTVNNVEQILLQPTLGTKYSVTVVGRSVNVNAVTAQTNNALGQYAPNVVQDYALVISAGDLTYGQVSNAFTVVDGGAVINPTTDQDVTAVMTTNAPLFNQIAGASSPLLGTNTLPLGTNTIWGPDGVVTIGETNQWHFYLVTNTGPTADYTNAAFITFQSSTLSIPRMGVLDPLGLPDATRPEADIDLYVSQDPSITNLNPVAISNALAGTSIGGVGDGGVALTQGGTEFVFFTNSAPGQIYYVGVKSEDREGAEYAFLPVFTATPFSSLDQNGNQIVHGLLLPQAIPDGDNAHPGITNIFALAIYPMVVESVIVTNLINHENYGDLYGLLSFGGQHVVLNNHDGFGNTTNRTLPIVYDDSRDGLRGTTNSDGPGSLANYRGMSALGPWILGEQDNAPNHTGVVRTFDLLIQPHRDLKEPGIIVAVPPGGWFIDYVDVPAGYTNLTFYATNVTIPVASPPIQMYEKLGNEPTLTDYDLEATLTNGNPEGASISIGPPLPMGRYFVGLYNPNTTFSQNVFISATLGINQSVNDVFAYNTNNTQLLDDAVTNSTIFVSATQQVASVNVGMVVNYPRVSDLTFTLVSPTGQRILLMENRGGSSTNLGSFNVFTNFFGETSSGGAGGDTNIIGPVLNQGVLIVDYDFFTLPDNMDVYYDGVQIFHSGLTPLSGTFTIPYGPGLATNLVVVMDGPDSGVVDTNSLWDYTPRVVQENYNYLTFTDDTNLAEVPIKFANPPFELNDQGTNYLFTGFEQAPPGDYRGQTNVYDLFGGFTVPTNIVALSTIETNGQFVQVTNVLLLTNNLVSVVRDARTAQGDSNYLALGLGTITRTLPFVAGRQYQVTYAYRGPGIVGWWRGEGNATDSSDPENNGNNGRLIGRFNYPGGVVGQAFQFEDPGNAYQFAGTNTYVQVPASATLNVGTNAGLTVEGWVNPTNLSRPEPLVEWLARVPTNVVDTNLVVVQGPMFDPSTGHYYYLLGATNWSVSEAWAEQLGGHLVTLETANEENWVYDTFTEYGTRNRDLWTGLGYTNSNGTFGWTSGYTNLTYTNWAPAQPQNCSGNDYYVAILGPTNAYPGLWQLEDNLGQTCGNPPIKRIYGVVEVSAIPTNGVQFWISGTNGTPGDTNVLQGCLYANIVDTNYISHQIFSLPGLLTSNVYQHVALTYNTNTGVAALFLNGTNVATTNLGVFVPKTDGDLLIGWDMSSYTNNFYAGDMDEMSIYSRALSDAEILSIYQISVPSTNGIGNTNGLIGKFDPSVFPPLSLAKFAVSLGSTTNVLYADNTRWQLGGFTFVAQTNSLPFQFTGLEPGVLLDSMSIAEASLDNIYYLPEQALAALNGDSAYGDWTLQVWDNRLGAYLTNLSQIVTWQLSFTLVSNAVIAATLPPQTPVVSTVPAGQVTYYAVPVPVWAHVATNILVSSDQPVDLYFNQTNPPTGSNPNDYTLLNNVTSGYGFPSLITNAPVPPSPLLLLLTNQTYYLGVRNLGSHSATVTLEVDYDILQLTNGVPFGGDLTNEYNAVRYYSYNVNSNAYEATFQLLKLSGNADLVLSKGVPLPSLTNASYGSFNSRNADENIYLLTNSAPVPVSPGRWYLGVFNRDNDDVYYSVLAKEIDTTNGSFTNAYAVINLTNAVPFTWNAGPGAALTNFFHFQPTNVVAGGVTNFVQGVRFELYDLSGNGDLTVQTDAPPLAPQFFQSSQNRSTVPELIFIYSNNVLTNLATDWYLGVPNHEITNITYTIVASMLTNGYFPAFPGAGGAGGGALGAGHAGSTGTVYHVMSTADSGLNTLRDGVSAPNRTIVFDIAGNIYLNSPLTITNSYLTIAGQTSPGGITVVGQVTTVQSAHDVVMRDIRFRSVLALPNLTNNFEGSAPADYMQGASVGGWAVTANQASVVADTASANGGHRRFLALANGAISNSISTVPGRTYKLSLNYRGPGIAGWWRGEGNAKDVIYGNNATTTNDIAYAPGIVGNKAFSLNGSSSELIIPSSPTLTVTNFTFEGWIFPTSSQYEPIFEYGGANEESDLHFWVNGWGLSQVPGMLYVNLSPNGPQFASSAGIVPPNTWSHVACTLDVNSGRLNMYLNGTNVASTSLSTSSTILYPTAQVLNLGWRNANSQEALRGTDFAGRLDEMSVYRRALSASEIKAIYSNGSSGKSDPAFFMTSPVQSLAEAVLSVAGVTNNVLLGNNTNWQTQDVTFIANGTATPIVVSGVTPGVLIDSESVISYGDLGNSLQFNTASNVIVDHISTSWSTNDDLAVLNSTNVTVQWSIMADSLYTTNGYPGAGSLLHYGGGMLSFDHNLYADNYTASPYLGDNLVLDFVNNVIFNWGFRPGLSGGTNDLTFSTAGCTNELNYVANYLVAGIDTAIFATNNYNITNIAFFGGQTNALVATWIFQTNNFIDSDTNGFLNGSDTGWGMFTNDYTRFGRAFAVPAVPVDEAYQAYEKVLDFAGVNMGLRDPVDTNIVTKVRTQTGRLIGAPGTLPLLSTNLPYLDTDQDGLPDFWERTFTPANLFIPSAYNDYNGDGYSDLEEYNNWLAGLHALTITNTPVGVDLYQLCGESGHLAFFVTNGVHGQVYLTNVLGLVTNTGTWSNSIAVFVPTNSAAGGTNYYGYGSFSFFVTNLDTAAYVGPMPVSVIVSAVPIQINSNIPPVIITLTSGVADPTNYGGSDFYHITVTTNDYAALFELDAPTGPMALVVKKGSLPSLSDFDYYTNLPPAPGNLEIAVLTNSVPVPLSPGEWYMAAVNESGSNVVYSARITTLQKVSPPEFIYPTNTTVITNLETVPLMINCMAVDENSPQLPLSYSVVSGPAGLTMTNNVIYWTPSEAQGPSTNSVQVSVSNGAFAVTNMFTIIVEESNLPPVLPYVPNQFVIVPNTLVVTNQAFDFDIPTNALTYTLFSTVTGPNIPVIDTNGVITWTPLPGQVETNYLLTTVVTDTNPWAVNSQSLSATNVFDVFVAPSFTPGVPITNITVGAGNIIWFAIPVPTNAIYATNTLIFSTLPVNMWFSTNIPPSITNAGDRALLWNVTNGISVLSTNLATAPTNIVQGGYYFLGIENTNPVTVTGELEIDFGYAPAPLLSLPVIPDQYIAAGDTLVVTNTATDLNPGAVLGYVLSTAPTGATISASGIITWATSTDMAVPTNFLFTTVVTDTNAHLSATNSFEVVVLPGVGNGLPPTNVISPNGINWFYVHVPPNADMATNFLLFATAPVNLWFSANVPPSITAGSDFELLTNQMAGSHVITTTSTPRLIPGSRYFLGVQNPNSFAVTNAVDVKFHLLPPPVFSLFSIVQTNRNGTNGYVVTWYAPTNDQFHLQWTAALVPAHWSNFNGVISYTSFVAATNSQFQYFDDGSQTGGFGPTRFYRLLLLNSPSNTAPFFVYSPVLFYASPGVMFSYTNVARDWDIPAQILVYSVTNSLGATNVSVNGSGVITWTPNQSQLGLTNIITTVVTDNGVPPKSATNVFSVIVSTNSAAPAFGSIALVGNGVRFLWTAPTNEQFQVQWTTNLAKPNWQTFPAVIVSSDGNFSFIDTNMPLLLMKFYQLILMP